MKNYLVNSPRLGLYELEAKNKDKLRKLILEKEEITFSSKELIEGGFIFLEQDNPMWDEVKIGNTHYELGDWGCTITSLSMLTYWYGDYKTPEWIAKNLEYTSYGAIYWKSMNGKLPMDFVYRYYYRDFDKIKEIVASKDNACVVEVPYGKNKHWLAVIGIENGLIVGADPLDGKKCYPEKKYGTITGFAEVKRSK